MKSWIMRAVAWVWLAVTVAALAGMFHLWYVREWKTYGSLEGAALTRAVLSRLGMDPSLESAAETLRAEWPPDTHYAFAGNPDHASYLQYLILPRLPSGSGRPGMRLGPGASAGPVERLLNPESAEAFRVFVSTSRIAPGTAAPLTRWVARPILGIAAFVAVALGLGYGCARLLRFATSTLPEEALLGFAALGVLYVASKSWFGQAAPGMWLGISGGACFAVCGLWRAWSRVADSSLSKKWFSSASRLARTLALHQIGRLSNLWRASVLASRVFQRADRAAASKAVPEAGKDSDWIWLSVAIAAIVWSFMMAVVVGPDEWDCWANWAAKAKLLALGNDGLRGITAFGPPDYPPFWPALWSAAAWFCGGWEDRWVKGLGPLMLALCAWEMVAVSVRVTGGRRAGLIAAAILCSAPVAPLVASWGYAEPLLWLALSCVYGVVVRPDRQGSASRNVMLAILVTCCVMTKNEGAVAVLALSAWRLFCPDRTRWIETLVIVATALVVRAAWTAWIHHGALTPVSGDIGLSDQWRQVSEWGKALLVAGRLWADPRLWGAGPMLLLVMLCLNTRGTWARRCVVLLPAALMLATAMLIAIMRPGDMNWKIGTAWSRLTLQAMVPVLMLLIPLSATAFTLTWHDKHH